MSDKRGRILLLSAYDAASHKYWHQLLRDQLTDWDWQLLTLPARHFSWRIRGNPLYWAQACRDTLEQPYDLLLATSMVDLSTLRGLVPALTRIPSLLYFHENQFAYPPGKSRHGPLEAQMVSLYAALAADQLLFNSHYNQTTFMQGCADLLGRLPDAVPAGVLASLESKAEVLPVPLIVQEQAPRMRPAGDLQLLWNHRWEYDKGPAELLLMVTELLAQSVSFKLHVVGQQFRQQPQEFLQLQSLLQQAGALGEWGYIDQASDYHTLLRRCDVVLSTALHDFQGLAVLEACAAGCTPLVPDRLAYPEWFETEHRYQDQQQAVRRIAELAAMKRAGQRLPSVDVSALSTTRLIPRYQRVLRSQLSTNSVS